MQRPLKKSSAGQQGEPETERLANFRGGEPPLTSTKILGRTSLVEVFAILFATKKCEENLCYNSFNMGKMNPVVHFEMPAKDKKRVSDFYSQAFGWNMQTMGAEYGGYTLAMTTESTEQGPIKPGAINGGFWEPKNEEENQPPHVVISVDNLEESMKKVTEAGGKVIGGSKGEGKPDDIPGVGLYITIEDCEGNHVGMLQPTT